MWTKKLSLCFIVASKLYDTCEETVQYSAYLLSGSKCIVNVCGPGYYYLHDRCNQYIGIATFYYIFYNVKDGKHIIKYC